MKRFALPLLAVAVLGGCAVYEPAYDIYGEYPADSHVVYGAPVYAPGVIPYYGPSSYFNFGYHSGPDYRREHYYRAPPRRWQGPPRVPPSATPGDRPGHERPGRDRPGRDWSDRDRPGRDRPDRDGPRPRASQPAWPQQSGSAPGGVVSPRPDAVRQAPQRPNAGVRSQGRPGSSPAWGPRVGPR